MSLQALEAACVRVGRGGDAGRAQEVMRAEPRHRGERAKRLALLQVRLDVPADARHPLDVLEPGRGLARTAPPAGTEPARLRRRRIAVEANVPTEGVACRAGGPA